MAKMLKVPERKLVPMSSSATSQIGRASLVEELTRIPGAPDPVLLETLPKGVAFHHAGLPFDVCPFKGCIWPALGSAEPGCVCFTWLQDCCTSSKRWPFQ